MGSTGIYETFQERCAGHVARDMVDHEDERTSGNQESQ